MLSAYPPPSVAASPRAPSIPLMPYAARITPSSPIPRSPVLPAFDTRSANVSSQHSRPASAHSSPVQDILFPGDVIGQGLDFQGERVRLLPISANHHNSDDDLKAPSIKFEVVKALGTGSYAVVYQVRQILSGYPPATEDLSPISAVDFDDIPSFPAPVRYGREYALKCLSKADLDKDALSAQMFEVCSFQFPCLASPCNCHSQATIHQALPTHPNIVTLYRTLETPSYLLLLLEYVPGQDLFYFLEQSCDHYEPQPPTSPSSNESHTPPTPSLLSSLNPDQLLSRTRLRLISSMFSQMCQAVAVCHAVNVFHRDIKPENFIVTDGWVKSPDGRQERKVVVKLTDFGLSTNDVESADMDCGSAPYMSYGMCLQTT
jgi:serine/threonine protein kinase